MSSSTQIPIRSSALSAFLSAQSTSTHPPPATALPLEILHNLRHQHSWTDLRLHPASTTTTSPAPPSSSPGSTPPPTSDPDSLNPPIPLLSGTPPKPLYTHPDLQLKLLQASIPETQLPPEREWVLPTSLGRKWTLREFCEVFDSLPVRPVRSVRGVRVARKGGEEGGSRARGGGAEGVGGDERGARGGEEAEGMVRHQDAKRVLLAMKAHDGRGGDGTVVYYIVQEGEVKPRQN